MYSWIVWIGCRSSASFSSSHRLDSPTQMWNKIHSTFLLLFFFWLVLATKLQVAIVFPTELLCCSPARFRCLFIKIHKRRCLSAQLLAHRHQYRSTMHYLVPQYSVFGIALQHIFTCAMRIPPKVCISLLLFSTYYRLQSFLFSVGVVDMMLSTEWLDVLDAGKKKRGESKEQEKKNMGYLLSSYSFQFIPLQSLDIHFICFLE